MLFRHNPVLNWMSNWIEFCLQLDAHAWVLSEKDYPTNGRVRAPKCPFVLKVLLVWRSVWPSWKFRILPFSVVDSFCRNTSHSKELNMWRKLVVTRCEREGILPVSFSPYLTMRCSMTTDYQHWHRTHSHVRIHFCQKSALIGQILSSACWVPGTMVIEFISRWTYDHHHSRRLGL